MKERKISPEDALSFPVSPARLAGLLGLLEAGEISAASAKEVFAAMLDSPAEPADDRRESAASADLATPGRSRRSSTEIVAGNPSQAALYRSGKTQTFGWFVGQVMKKTGGRADPAAVRSLATRPGPPAEREPRRADGRN